MSASGRHHLSHADMPLLDDWSIEITARDAGKLDTALACMPRGSQVSVTFLPNESFEDRIVTAERVRAVGLEPMPHISARRIASVEELDRFLAALVDRAGVRRIFVIAGDTAPTKGPYQDALAVIESGLLEKHGITHVGIAGYPEGHPQIADELLWSAMEAKIAALASRGMTSSIMTQFGFNADPALEWLEALRARGISIPVRIGVAGPTSVKTLMKFAAICGVASSAKVLAKYGISVTKLFGSAGPEPVMDELNARYDPALHGLAHIHFFPFGGLEKCTDWVRAYQSA